MLLLPAVFCLVLAVPATPRAVSGDRHELLTELDAWSERFRSGLADFDPESHSGLRSLLGDVHRLWAEQPDVRRDIVLALLDLEAVGLERHHASDPHADFDRTVRSLVRTVDRALESKLDREMKRFLAREVLLLSRIHSPGRQAAAVRQFRDHENPEGLLAILQCARSKNELLVDTALETLVGWDDEAVHMLMYRRLVNASAPTATLSTQTAERHFNETRVARGSRSEARLAHFVKLGVLATDWREASLAVSVSRGLEAEQAVPALIDGMKEWVKRGEESGGMVRLQHEIADALTDRSGRQLGPRPDRWSLWWKAVQSGDLKLIEASADRPRVQYTTAEFFGLRPKTDRVTFVIDRSGSMDTAFGNSTDAGSGPARTRYMEAIDQMIAFLEALRDDAKFNLILFSDKTEVWRTRLQPANGPNLKGARQWLKTKRPDGGTMLREGVERAMRMDRNGRLDLDKLEADTVIVLCDGATTDGSGWVPPFLSRVNSEARVIFHCVQIGRTGDGTLELLASRTGGDFVKVDG